MIKQKLKTCKECGKEAHIFSHKLCKFCFNKQNKAKIKAKPPKPTHTTPIKRKPLKPSKKPISRQSVRGIIRQKKYQALREAYLLEHPICEVCKCTPATEIHHKKKRVGANLYKHFLAVDRSCHIKIENNPEWAYEMGYSIPQLNKTKDNG